MENANLGKRLLYGFAAALLFPAVLLFIVAHININLPLWFWWLVLVFSALSFCFGYRYTSEFEKIFMFGLDIGARLDPKLGSTVQAINKIDPQRKMPISLGWFFFLLLLTCFILLFTRFRYLFGYIFAPGFFLFMFLVAIKYKKNQ